MIRAPRPALLALCFFVLSGCTASQRVFAGRKDYALYRDYRLADTLLERLRTGNRYLKDVPDGRFRPEVQGWFTAREAQFLKTAHDRPSLLRAYLSAMPDGPHAQHVIDRLLELELLRKYRDAEALREEQRIARAVKEMEDAARGREDLQKKLAELLRVLGDVRSFGAPVSALPEQLFVALGVKPSELPCDAERCRKTLTVKYALPSGRDFAHREAALSVALELEQGVLRSVELSGPELFSRLSEAISLVPTTRGDFSARVTAIAKSAGFAENVLEARLPKATCERPPVAPLVLVRVCDGVQLELFAGELPGAPDGARIRAQAR